MKRIIYTGLVSALFLAMLTGTSKKRPPEDAGPRIAQPLSVPETAGWTLNELGDAKVRFHSPPNSLVDRDKAGGIKHVNGRHFTVHMPGALDVVFSSKAAERMDPAQLVEWYRTQPGFVGFIFQAPDAVVGQRVDQCEVTACTTGEPATRMCARASVDDDHHRLTPEECMQIVAIARSVEQLP
jgi:hypothetical protein